MKLEDTIIKRDTLGRVIPFCTRDHSSTEMQWLLPSDPEWDAWVCPVCNILAFGNPAAGWRAQAEREAPAVEARLRRQYDLEHEQRKIPADRIAELEAELRKLKGG